MNGGSLHFGNWIVPVEDASGLHCQGRYVQRKTIKPMRLRHSIEHTR
jgi:hypothetical protein